MSTLKVNRIEPRTGDSVEIVGFEAPTTPVKAFASVSKYPTFSVNNSEGFSSIVDSGVGLLEYNFLTPMPDEDYSVAGSNNSPNHEVQFARLLHINSNTQNKFTAVILNYAGANFDDVNYIGIMVAR